MADLSVTAASVLKTSGSTVSGTAGATITAGQAVYFDSATNKWKLALCGGTTDQAGGSGVGIALCGASNGQPITVQTQGPLNPGATVTVGQVYAVSANGGGIAPYSDLVSTNRVTLLGVGTTAAELTLAPNATVAVKP